METNTIERLEIERIAEQFRVNEGFTEDANIAYMSAFDTGRKWQYDKLKEERDLLIDALKMVVGTTSEAMPRLREDIEKLLNNINK